LGEVVLTSNPKKKGITGSFSSVLQDGTSRRRMGGGAGTIGRRSAEREIGRDERIASGLRSKLVLVVELSYVQRVERKGRIVLRDRVSA
jgi:hypothetical protein